MAKSITKNVFFNLVKTATNAIVPLIIFPYVTRTLSPEYLGKIDFGNAFVGYFGLLATLGVEVYAIRECSAVRNDREELGKVASQIFSINVCTMLAAYVLMFLTLFIFSGLAPYISVILLLSLNVFFTVCGTTWLNTAMEDFGFITVATCVLQLISLAAVFMFVREPSDYLNRAAISIMPTTVLCIINVFYRRRFCKVRFTRDMGLKKHFVSIYMLFGMLVSQTIFNNADIIMLGLIKNEYEVGIYGTAVKCFGMVSQLIGSILWVVLPRLSILCSDKNTDGMKEILGKVFSFLMTLGLPCAAGMFAIADEVILIVGGKDYAEAATPLRILCLSFVISQFGMGFCGNFTLLPAKKEKRFMVACVLTAAANIAANAFIIPKFGAAGAAATTAAGNLLALLILLPAALRVVRIDKIVRRTAGPVAGCILIILFCRAVMKLGLPFAAGTSISIVGSVVLYGILMAVTKNETFIYILGFLGRKLKKQQ